MFETHDETELPIPPGLGDPGERMWPYIVRRLFVPWLHVVRRVAFEENGVPCALQEMLFLTRVGQLQQLQETSDIEIVAVDLVSPGHLNGTHHWKFEPLAEIWEGIEPGTEDRKAYVYVLENGVRYPDLALASSESELRNRRRLLKFKNGVAVPGWIKNKR